MKHEKIFKRPDGCRVKITVYITTDPCRNTFRWDGIEMYSLPGKRKWLRGAYMATPEEILETKLELHNLLKPTLNNV